MMNDPIGDMLTRIRNGLMRGKGKVSTPASKLRASVLDVLEAEGYIRGYTRTDFDNGRHRNRAEILRRNSGYPRDQACIEARSSCVLICENSATRG